MVERKLEFGKTQHGAPFSRELRDAPIGPHFPDAVAPSLSKRALFVQAAKRALAIRLKAKGERMYRTESTAAYPRPIVRRRPIRATLLCLAFAFAGKAHAADGCGTFPPKLDEMAITSGLSACDLKAIGEKPLWHGLPDGTARVLRFVFTQGHGLFFRVVTITQKADGSASMKVSGTRRRDDGRTPEERLPVRRIPLSPEAMARILALAEETGAWEFEIGSWDENEIYLHCQVLQMERPILRGIAFPRSTSAAITQENSCRSSMKSQGSQN